MLSLATTKVIESHHTETQKKKTQKKKTTISNAEKAKLWDAFETETKQTKPTIVDFENDFCTLCQNILVVTEEGFPGCSNNNCGVIYTNILDFSPEWRYYGADDKNTRDPTRCGNPINPLLVESSFGCKVLCNPGSS